MTRPADGQAQRACSSSPEPPSAAQVGAATRASYASFAAAGFIFASWVSRIPQVRDELRLSPSDLGLLLLAASVGAVVALPLAGLVVSRLGTRRAVTVTSLVSSAGLLVIAAGFHVGVLPVAAGLFAMGVGYGTWDVAMNVEGAAVEQRLGRSILSRFHAAFSVGTVLGALVGAALVSRHVPVTLHLLVVGVLTGAFVPTVVRGYLPEQRRAHSRAGSNAMARRRSLAAWTERRTVLIGIFVLASAFSEGTGNDWLGVAVIDGYHVAAYVGSLSFAVFVLAMTAGRWYGPALLDRYGRVRVLRPAAALAAVGLVLVVSGQALPVLLVGIVAWGAGTALGFPVGMSAAADDPVLAAARVSVVSSIGYTAFLAGPPLIGLLGNHIGVLHSLTVATGVLAVGFLVAGACRPLPATSARARD